MSLNLTATLCHTVFFWLKNPNNKKDRFEFENAIKKLIRNNHLSVSCHLGTPADSEQRDVVDSSYTYCYIVNFPSLEDQNKYQIDPHHLLFIEEAKHLWAVSYTHLTLPTNA